MNSSYPPPFDRPPSEWTPQDWESAFKQLEPRAAIFCLWLVGRIIDEAVAEGLYRAFTWLSRQNVVVPIEQAHARVRWGIRDYLRGMFAERAATEEADENLPASSGEHEPAYPLELLSAMRDYFSRAGLPFDYALVPAPGAPEEERVDRLRLRNRVIYPLAFFIARFWSEGEKLEQEFVGTANPRGEAAARRRFLRLHVRKGLSGLRETWPPAGAVSLDHLLRTAPYRFCRDVLVMREKGAIFRAFTALVREDPTEVTWRFRAAAE